MTRQDIINSKTLQKDPFFQKIQEQKKMFASYDSNYRKVYRTDATLSKLDNDKFTDMITLPCKKYTTLQDVFQDKGYTLDKKIGRGGYGLVWKGKNLAGGQPVAIKQINTKQSSSLSRMLTHLKTEIFIMERYPHLNVITLYDHFIVDDNAYIVMELATQGSFASLIENNGALGELDSREYFVQVLRGLIHLHSCNIAHRYESLCSDYFSK